MKPLNSIHAFKEGESMIPLGANSDIDEKIFAMERIINSLMERVAILERQNKDMLKEIRARKYVKLQVYSDADEDY